VPSLVAWLLCQINIIIIYIQVPNVTSKNVSWLHFSWPTLYVQWIGRFITRMNFSYMPRRTPLQHVVWRATPLSFDASFLENTCEYRNICINVILPENRVPAQDAHRWQSVSGFISFHAIIFESRTVGSQTNRRENFRKIASENAENCRCRQSHCRTTYEWDVKTRRVL